MNKVDLQNVIKLYKEYNEGDKFKDKLMCDVRKITSGHNKRMYNALKGVNAKVTDLEFEAGQEKGTGYIPPFVKNNLERCASCNTDLTKKNIKDRLDAQGKGVNPNKYYFKELRDKAH